MLQIEVVGLDDFCIFYYVLILLYNEPLLLGIVVQSDLSSVCGICYTLSINTKFKFERQI